MNKEQNIWYGKSLIIYSKMRKQYNNNKNKNESMIKKVSKDKTFQDETTQKV